MLKKLAVAVSTAALTATGLAVTASSAEAASYPTCNSKRVVYASGSSLFTYQPYYTGTGSRNCVMSQGAQSDAVYGLQIAIDTCYQDISRDGIYGPQTKEAVEDVQRAEDAGVDGVYGPETRKAMKWPLYKGGSGSVHGCSRLGV